jgi:predicted ATPase
MPNDKTRFIRKLRPRNFLSFGPDFPGLSLQSLNLLIGPNGSGKSNFIEAVSFMRASAAAKDFREVTLKGGGVAEWIWKGSTGKSASLELDATYPGGKKPLRHAVSFGCVQQAFMLEDERVEETERRDLKKEDVYFFYRYQHGDPVVNSAAQPLRKLARESIELDRSILLQRRDPEIYPELAWLASNYEKARIYREWEFGRNAMLRAPQPTDSRNDVLLEDFSNKGLFLSRLRKSPKAKRTVVEYLSKLYEGLTDFEVVTEGNTVQVFLHEGDFSIPATRLSDGTLRYLCLVAILCDPEPPPVICLEEPELGLHPDILPTVADLLKSASERTQLIVTTHSDILVDAMTEMPEAVVVCEKHDGKTEMNRLSKDGLKEWLDKYRLGQLWIEGQLGGKRW